MKKSRTIWLALATAALIPIAMPAAAQEAAAATDTETAAPAQDTPPAQAAAPASDTIGTVTGDDIVVTAQRRAESVQTTPLAISALSGSSLLKSGVSNIVALNNSLPNVNINETSGTVRITIRGIGIVASQPNAEGAIAYHVDGVYVSRPEATSDGFFDVDRVEVVRGPQGTLYGRNATGGAINLITRDPTDYWTGNGEIRVGNYDMISTEAGVGGPIAQGVSFRVAGQTVDRGGWGHDGAGRALNDQRTRAIRGKIKLEPSSNFTNVLSADYFHEDDASGAYLVVGAGLPGRVPIGVQFGFPLAADPYRDSNGLFPAILKKNDWSITNTANLDVSPLFKLTSVTGYRSVDFYQQSDGDSTAANITQFMNATRDKQFSQELRASGSSGDFTYLVGGYYFNDLFDFDSQSTRNPVTTGGANFLAQGLRQIARQKTIAKALFGQVSYELTPTFGIDLGGRYSWETRTVLREQTTGINLSLPYNRDVIAPFVASRPRTAASFEKFTPKVTLRLKPDSETLIYATYAQGFRSGGFALGSLTPPFLPENITDYEAGIKRRWLDGALQTNISGFYYEYKNLQTTKTNPAGGASLVESAGRARIYGMEASIVAKPVTDFQLNADIGLLNARYQQYGSVDPYHPLPGGVPQDLRGYSLPQAPDFSANVGAQYTWHRSIGDLTMRWELQSVSRTYFTSFENDQISQKPYTKVDAYLNYTSRDGKWNGGLFIRNISNLTTAGSIAAGPNSGNGPIYYVATAPRTFGARAGFNF